MKLFYHAILTHPGLSRIRIFPMKINLSVLLIFFNFLTISYSQSNFSCDSYCKCLGTFVDCSNQQLSKVATELPTFIETLRLNKNVFTEIPVLSDTPNLTYLNLAHNKISSIDEESFGNLFNLKTLELNNNAILELSKDSFVNCSKLESLNLNSNHISKIDSGSFTGLKYLKELKLNRNKISQIQKDIFRQLNALQTLELNRNQITNVIGLSFKELEHLIILRLRQNTIDELADGAFYGLYNLQELCLDYNKLSHISKGWLYGLELLNHLNVSYNRIQYLNSGWESCPHLTELDLSNNKIHSIEKGTFEHLMKLRLLKLDNNYISYIEDATFDHTPMLQHLDLSNNQLAWIVENKGGAFFPLKKLTNLYMAANKILMIVKNAFAGLESLTYLDLDKNEIAEIKENPFSETPNLRTLILNSSSFICDCQFAWFPAWLRTSRINKQNDVKCIHPLYVKKKLVHQISPSDFKCSSKDHPQPSITVNPEDVVALVGHNVTLRCGSNSSSDSDMEFVWKRNNYRVENVSFRRYASAQTYGVTQFSDIQLVSVTMANNGFYQCSVSNAFGIAYSKLSQLSVLVFPNFVKVPSNVVVKVGATAKLECAATGYPPPHVFWQKDGGSDFPAAKERRIKVEDTFSIVDVKLADVGIYTCTARNEAGVITANASLTALEPPSFSKKMENKEVILGEAVIIECMAVGSPKPKITWLKDGKLIEISKRHFLTGEDQLLIIMEVIKSDTGVYECHIANSMGVEYGQSKLVVVLPSLNADFSRNKTVVIVVVTVVIFIVGACVIWTTTILRGKKRKRAMPTALSPVDNKSENSCNSSKDSGTGDSTKRSYQDLLLSAGTNNSSIEIIHKENSESTSSIPEVTLPLLTTFHPISLDTSSSHSSSSSSVIPFIKDNFNAASKTRFVPSSTLSPLLGGQNKVEHTFTNTVVCSSPASSSGMQCACLMGTFKKKTEVCECVPNNSPVKHCCCYNTATNHCISATQTNDQHENNKCYGENGSKRPCSIPIPCHHSTHATHSTNPSCYKHPNSYLCLYMPQHHNIQ